MIHKLSPKFIFEMAAGKSYYYDNFRNYTVKYKLPYKCSHFDKDISEICKECVRKRKLHFQNLLKYLENAQFEKIYHELGHREYHFYENVQLIGQIQFENFGEPFISTVSGHYVKVNSFLVPENWKSIMEEYQKLDYEKTENPNNFNNWLEEVCWKINKGHIVLTNEMEESEVSIKRYHMDTMYGTSLYGTYHSPLRNPGVS